jgi:hypothetical protein
MTENYDREVTSQIIKFNCVGDFLKGTLTNVQKMEKVDKWGKINTVYTVKSKEGLFHDSRKNEATGKSDVDAKPTAIGEGEEWTIFAYGVTAGLMSKIKIGQKFMIKFVELKPSTKGQDAKIKKVFPAMDENGLPIIDTAWIESQKADGQFAEEVKNF